MRDRTFAKLQIIFRYVELDWLSVAIYVYKVEKIC